MWKASLAFAAVLLAAPLVLGAPADNPWPRFASPAPGPARAIGDYSAGCLQGARALPLDGPGYQVMRPSRLRYYGHPELVDFLRGLGRRVHAGALAPLLVGDLSQPRGGRAASGHASHQTGLDVDVWFSPPPRKKRPLPLALRETLSAKSVLDAKGAAVQPAQLARVRAILRLTVEDPRVDRVFVNPIIKRTLCAAPPAERTWLRKIRPWYGHDDHFHVRLACPAGNTDCAGQAPLPSGDGCDKLGWWFDPAAQAARREARKSYQEVVKEGRGWPERCDALLEPPAG